MGAIYFSINVDLAKILSQQLGIEHFIETGTFNGDTIDSLRLDFKTLDTVELSTELHAAALKRFSNDPSISCHLGDSPLLVKGILNKYPSEPVLVWLDAHWCAGDNTAGEDSQCPLLDEIKAVGLLHEQSILWIDDARYFTAPPPAPLIQKGWPTFQEVLDVLSLAHGGTHELIIADDTILLLPRIAAESVRDYLHHHGADWLKIAHNGKWFPEAIAGRDAMEIKLKSLESELRHINSKNLTTLISERAKKYFL